MIKWMLKKRFNYVDAVAVGFITVMYVDHGLKGALLSGFGYFCILVLVSCIWRFLCIWRWLNEN